jgi:hypothetical protein
VAQSKLGLYALQAQLKLLGINLLNVYGKEVAVAGLAFTVSQNYQDPVQNLRAMWTDMGDYLSRQYAGTDSTISSVSRDGRETFESKINHKTVTVQRFFLNTVQENQMQQSIEIVLGKFPNRGYSKELQKYIERQFKIRDDLKP